MADIDQQVEGLDENGLPDFRTYEGAWFLRGQLSERQEDVCSIKLEKATIEDIVKQMVLDPDNEVEDRSTVTEALKPYEDSYTFYDVLNTGDTCYIGIKDLAELPEKSNLTRHVIAISVSNSEIYEFDEMSAHLTPNEVSQILFGLGWIEEPDNTIDI